MTATYDLIADDYDQSIRLLPVRNYIEAFSVLQLIGDVRGLEVLDLACGTGFYARAMRRAGASRVVALDLSEGMIGVAKGIESDSPLGIDYRVADASSLTTLGSFDLVLGIYLLHYAATEQALRSMCAGIARNLKPGGRLVAFSTNPEIATEEDAYQSYGLTMRIPEPHANGAAIHFSIGTPEHRSPEITAYRWSRDTYDSALGDAHLGDIRWESPTVAPSGVEAHGAEMWGAYLARPHCLLLSCRKESGA